MSAEPEVTPTDSEERLESFVDGHVSKKLNDLAAREGFVQCRAIRCVICNIDTYLKPGRIEGQCPHCGATMVSSSTPRRMVQPFASLPLRVSRAQALKHIKKWRDGFGYWWVAGRLRRAVAADKNLSLTYLSYWIFDATTTSRYQCHAGDSAKPTPDAGIFKRSFRDIFVAGAENVPHRVLSHLRKNWDFQELEPFDDSHPEGATIECDRTDFAEAFKDAARRMDEPIRVDLQGTLGSGRIKTLKTRYDTIAFKHLLFPLWISSFRSQDQTFRVYIDAQTGQVHGQLPRSWTKICITLAAAAALAAALTFL